MSAIVGTRKFTEAEFEKLAYVTDEALIKHKPLVTRTADVRWYHEFDSPDGKYITVQIVDVDGIRQTQAFDSKYIHMWFKLAPETA